MQTSGVLVAIISVVGFVVLIFVDADLQALRHEMRVRKQHNQQRDGD